MLQIRVFRIAGNFFIRALQRWSWAGGLDPQCRFRDNIQDNFSILKISKFDIWLIKMLFFSIAKVEPLVLKMKIWSCLINLDCAFRKSYAITTSTPTTTYELVEHLVNIHLTHLFQMHPFSTPPKHQKILSPDVFRRWRKGALRTNGLMLFRKIHFVINHQRWHFSLFANYLFCVLQRLEEWEFVGLCTKRT